MLPSVVFHIFVLLVSLVVGLRVGILVLAIKDITICSHNFKNIDQLIYNYFLSLVNGQ